VTKRIGGERRACTEPPNVWGPDGERVERFVAGETIVDAE